MARKTHHYNVSTRWNAATAGPTETYASYSRDHELHAEARPVIPSSSDASFRGNPERWNPEDLLVGSLSGCHMLWYLHLCAVNGIRVLDYRDDAEGEMVTDGDGGRFESVTLRPRVEIAAGGDVDKARSLHAEAGAACFIANSVNFRVGHDPEIVVSERES